MGREVGSRIREIRKSQNITLKTISQATGLSESYLSQVERGTCAASVSSLKKIAKVLKTDMDVFLTQEVDLRTSSWESKYVCPAGAPYYYRVLSNMEDGKRIFCRQVTIMPRGEQELFPLEQRGFLYVLSGYLEMVLNGVADQLFPGDSLYHDETMELKVWNDSPYLVNCLYVTYRQDDNEEEVCGKK